MDFYQSDTSNILRCPNCGGVLFNPYIDAKGDSWGWCLNCNCLVYIIRKTGNTSLFWSDNTNNYQEERDGSNG